MERRPFGNYLDRARTIHGDMERVVKLMEEARAKNKIYYKDLCLLEEALRDILNIPGVQECVDKAKWEEEEFIKMFLKEMR